MGYNWFDNCECIMNNTNKKWGVAINDYAGSMHILYNQYGEKRVKRCHIRWESMIRRCYSSIYKKSKPTYIGCKVYPLWLKFSIFLKWYVNEELKYISIENLQLDKDILGNGQLYSPATCCFVPGTYNNFFTDSGAIRGQYPQGVRWHKNNQKFDSRVTINSKQKHLGFFDTSEEAAVIYLIAKYHNLERLLAETPQFSYAHGGMRRQMRELIHTQCERYNLDESQIYFSI